MNFSQDEGFVTAVTKCSDNIRRFLNGLNLGYDPNGEVKEFPVDWGLLARLGCMQLDGEGLYFRILDFYNSKIGSVQHGSWRSYEEQEKLFAIGRQIGYKKVYGEKWVSDNQVPDCLRSAWTYEKDIKEVGSVVTNTRGGQSFHNYGLAVDIVLRHYGESIPQKKAVKVNGKRYDTLRKVYEDSGLIRWAKLCGLEWGGYWKDFPDPAHFQDTEYDIIPYKLYGDYNLRNEKNCSFSAVRDYSKGLWNKALEKYDQVLKGAKDAWQKTKEGAKDAWEGTKDAVEDGIDGIQEGFENAVSASKKWLKFLALVAGGVACLYVFFGFQSRKRR